MSLYTHPSYRAMAEAIIARAEKDGDAFPGIVPHDNPAIMAMGYILAVARSKRTTDDQWSCSLQSFKDEPVEFRVELTRKLQALNPALRASGG